MTVSLEGRPHSGPGQFIEDEYLLIPPDYRLSNSIPFTYRDGYTYLQMMEEMRRWVDDGLKTALSNALESLAVDYNQKVHALIIDLNKEMENYKALPPQVRQMLRDAIAKYDDEFKIFKNSLEEYLDRRINRDHIEVTNWLRGGPSTLEELLFDMHNRYTVNGLLAEDFSRMAATCKEIDDLPMSISEIETNGKVFIREFDRDYIFSPITGNRMNMRDALYEVVEMMKTGSGNMVSWTVDYFETPSLQDIENRFVPA